MRLAALIAFLAAAATALSCGGSLAGTPLVYGYPYAARCPAAGIADAVDRWKMDECNCTSFVAWALAANGYRTDWFVPGSMDAWNWPHVARLAGLQVGRTPHAGAVAVWPEVSRFGHVAYVTSVRPGGLFDVAEYNLPGGRRFAFDERESLRPGGDVTFIYVPARRRA